MDLMGKEGCREIRSERCELCNDVASFYCPSDSAFLCGGCDSKVHGANFLVARHQRLPLNYLSCCSMINYSKTSSSSSSSTSPSNIVSTTETEESTSSHGGGVRRDFLRRKCNPNNNNNNNASRGGAEAGQYDVVVVSTDSDRILSTVKVEAILRNWCRKLGLDAGSVVPPAIHVYEATAAVKYSNNSSSKLRAAVLAASLLAGIKILIFSRRSTSTMTMTTTMRKVEEVTGVPRKVIAAVEAKLTKTNKLINNVNHYDQSHNSHLQEGWAES